jgi:hypothetical protein
VEQEGEGRSPVRVLKEVPLNTFVAIARRSLGLLAIVAAPVATAAAIQLQSPTFSGGAVESASSSYSLGGTIAEVGVAGSVGSASYALVQGFWGGRAILVATAAPDLETPGAAFANGLRQNVPNPFRGVTNIAFTTARAGPVRVDVYDVSGRLVHTLHADVTEPGVHVVPWSGRDAAGQAVRSGVYFYRLTIGNWSDTRKMLRLQ